MTTTTTEIGGTLTAPRSKVCAALVAAQADLRNPPKDKTANTGTYSYKYADLASILDLVRPTLAKHGLAITQDVVMQDGRLLIYTRLIHASGECLDFGPLAGQVGTSWQQTGGGITYARRYALQAVLGLQSEDDTDAAPEAPPAKAKQRLQAVEQAKASDEDVARWLDLIAAASTWVELKSIADEIAAHDVGKAERADLVARWTARKAEVAP
jgi:hypothetical protein